MYEIISRLFINFKNYDLKLFMNCEKNPYNYMKDRAQLLWVCFHVTSVAAILVFQTNETVYMNVVPRSTMNTNGETEN